jgi:phage terminase large subunit-like protein
MTAEIVAHPAEGNDDDVAVTARHLQTLIQKQLAEETP